MAQSTPEKNIAKMSKEKTTSISRAFLVVRMLFFTTVIALSLLIATGMSHFHFGIVCWNF